VEDKISKQAQQTIETKNKKINERKGKKKGGKE